jgi:acetyltransferase-like isoleucine patch superfamily enzyme
MQIKTLVVLLAATLMTGCVGTPAAASDIGPEYAGFVDEMVAKHGFDRRELTDDQLDQLYAEVDRLLHRATVVTINGASYRLRAHQGQITLGAKVVMGRDNVVNSYLDVEVGDASLLADWIYICDFDHRYERLDVPIKDQGIITSPVRIGTDVWIGEKATVLRGVDVGQGAIVASHGVVNRDVPPFAIVAGIPARVVRSRLPAGVHPEEALDLLRRGQPIPGDPLDASCGAAGRSVRCFLTACGRGSVP